MPLYEYQCRQCQRRIEKIQSFSAEPLKVCESCGGELERLISAPAIQFKGTGWYVTDYAKGSSGAAAGKSESPAAAPADGKTTAGGGDAKPAASKPAADTKSTTTTAGAAEK